MEAIFCRPTHRRFYNKNCWNDLQCWSTTG